MVLNNREKEAAKELSDFLKNPPYSCNNWDHETQKVLGPYEARKTLSDRYRMMSPLEQTQYIDEDDIPEGIDWTLPEVKRRNYSLMLAVAFLTAFSLSYCTNNSEVPKVSNDERRPSYVNSAAFHQGK